MCAGQSSVRGNPMCGCGARRQLVVSNPSDLRLWPLPDQNTCVYGLHYIACVTARICIAGDRARRSSKHSSPQQQQQLVASAGDCAAPAPPPPAPPPPEPRLPAPRPPSRRRPRPAPHAYPQQPLPVVRSPQLRAIALLVAPVVRPTPQLPLHLAVERGMTRPPQAGRFLEHDHHRLALLHHPPHVRHVRQQLGLCPALAPPFFPLARCAGDSSRHDAVALSTSSLVANSAAILLAVAYTVAPSGCGMPGRGTCAAADPALPPPHIAAATQPPCRP
eukprot:scaffold85253_cov32-Phaeocystis_antarctica.AAC.3